MSLSMFTRSARFPGLAFAAVALASLYFALMSGHMHSIDGVLMYRQGESLAFEHSIFFSQPIWPGAPWLTSKYGIGQSLLYLPGLLIASWFHPYTPMSGTRWYDPVLSYSDPYYACAAAPVHVLVAVAAACFVALSCRELGLSRKLSLWAFVLYGVGSPAIIYARGDWSQQLEALCWIAAIYGALKFRRTSTSGAVLCSVALAYALLTRPVEGALIGLTILLLLLPNIHPGTWTSQQWRGLLLALAGISVGAVITLAINWARYGSPLIFGYGDSGWTTPLWLGLIGSTVSPARGILWEFPALLLVPLGVIVLLRTTHRKSAVLLTLLLLAQLLNVSTWLWWWGGGNFGLRLFVPALPLLAVFAAYGLTRLREDLQSPIALISVFAGLLFSIPCVLTDLAAGYGDAYFDPTESLRPEGYPLFSAFGYLHHLVASNPLDVTGIDILWVRLVRQTGGLSLLPMLLLLVVALWATSKAMAQSVAPLPDDTLPTSKSSLALAGAEDL